MELVVFVITIFILNAISFYSGWKTGQGKDPINLQNIKIRNPLKSKGAVFKPRTAEEIKKEQDVKFYESL